MGKESISIISPATAPKFDASVAVRNKLEIFVFLLPKCTKNVVSVQSGSSHVEVL